MWRVEVILFDHPIAPHEAHQLILVDDCIDCVLPGPTNIEGSRRQLHWLIIAEQYAPDRIQSKLAEFV